MTGQPRGISTINKTYGSKFKRGCFAEFCPGGIKTGAYYKVVSARFPLVYARSVDNGHRYPFQPEELKLAAECACGSGRIIVEDWVVNCPLCGGSGFQTEP